LIGFDSKNEEHAESSVSWKMAYLLAIQSVDLFFDHTGSMRWSKIAQAVDRYRGSSFPAEAYEVLIGAFDVGKALC